MGENWEWADALFEGSDWADIFQVEETEYNPVTGNHVYTNERGVSIVVTPEGNCVLGDDQECCPGCLAMPGDGLTPGCNHPDGCGYWRQQN